MSVYQKHLYLIISLLNILSSTCEVDNFKNDPALAMHIENMRKKVEEYCNNNADDVYMLDCQDIISRDWVIERYLRDNDLNEENTFTKILANLKFYKREGLQELTDDHFPAEFYATGYVVRQAKSKKGEAVYGFCQRCYKPLSKISEKMYRLGRKFLLFIMYKNRMELDYNSRLNYISLRDASYENLEIKYLMNIIENVNTKQPKMPGVLFALDLPTIVATTWNIIVGLLSSNIQKMLKVIPVNEFEKWVSLDELPTYVGGRLKNWNRIPEGVKSGKCLEHLKHIPRQEWDRFRSQNSVCIKEGMIDAGMSTIDDFLGHCREEIENPIKARLRKG